MLLEGQTAMPTNDPQRSARIAEYEEMRVTIAGMTSNSFLDTSGNALPSSYLAMPPCMHINSMAAREMKVVCLARNCRLVSSQGSP